MYISINWIKEFVNLDGVDIKNLINRFTLSVAEVEGVEEKGENTSNIIVAKIIEIADHPNSDHLHLLKLDIGNGETTECVCGAPNVRIGMLVPFAKLGAKVNGFEIVKAKIRGVESIGMCCSGKELGISDDNSGLLELYNVAPGTDFIAYSGLRDTIFEIDNKSLTNRPDLWCHYGIAREISALLDRPLKTLDMVLASTFSNLPALNIGTIDNEKCYRYSAIKIENVHEKYSPLFMQTRLFYCGMRGINLLTDLTNYVMLEVGQPMHAFDARKIEKIDVKQTTEKISFKTLDDVERNIPANELLIYGNNQPVAIAGIMGGKNSETEDDTTSIILESANFNGVSVRKLSSKLGLRTESSIRYEKILDPEICQIATQRFIYLLKQIDPNSTVTSQYCDYYANHFNKVILDVEQSYLDNYIGVKLNPETVVKILSSLDFKVYYANFAYHIEVPSFRSTKDVTSKVDIVEEITRIYGYNNIQPQSSKIDLKSVNQDKEHLDEIESKLYMAENLNYNEIHTYIWEDKTFNNRVGIETTEYLSIVNSLSPENTYIRSVLLPSLIANIEQNKAESFKIFEIGRVCEGLDKNNLAIENKKLAMIISNKNRGNALQELRDDIVSLVLKLKNKKVKFEEMQQDLSYAHPKNSALIKIDGEEIGIIASLHPAVKNKIDKKLDIAVAELDFKKLSKVLNNKIAYKEVSKFQPVSVDLNFVCDENMPYGNISNILDSLNTNLQYSYKLVDIYKNAETLMNKVSYTFNFNIVSLEKTLSSEEINDFMNMVIENCKKIGAELR